MSETPSIPPTDPFPGMPTPSNDKSWAAYVSLGCGIAALPGGCCCCLLGWPLAIAGIVFGVLGLKSNQNMLAKVGIVISALALIIPIVTWLLSVLFNFAVPFSHPRGGF